MKSNCMAKKITRGTRYEIEVFTDSSSAASMKKCNSITVAVWDLKFGM